MTAHASPQPSDAAAGAPSDRLDVLARRLAALEAEREIVAVLHRYAAAIDSGDADTWAGVFTHDGVWEVEGPGARFHLRIEGRDDLRRFAERHSRPPDAHHKHCVVEPSVDVDGDHATSVCYTFRLDGFPDGPVVQSFGRYIDRLVRDDRGRWRIAHRTLIVESSRPSPFGPRPATDAPDA